MTFTFYNYENCLSDEQLNETVDFLHTHLGQYGDPKEHIRKAVLYAMAGPGAPGGFVCLVSDHGVLCGAAVINGTGMKDYIPENLLVYIAVHANWRGRGVGRGLMQRVIEKVDGGIALHVEQGNPAVLLYQSLGFVNEYLEMRLTRKE